MQFNLKMLQRQKRAKHIKYKRIIQPLWCLKEFKSALLFQKENNFILPPVIKYVKFLYTEIKIQIVNTSLTS